MHGAARHGIRAEEVRVDFPAVMDRKRKVVAKSAAGVAYLGVAWSLDVKALRALLHRIRGGKAPGLE